MPLRSFTDAEILVSERRRVERPLIVLVWIGIALFSLAEGSPFFLIAGTVVTGIKLQAVSRGKELLLRRWLVNACVILATIVAVMTLVLRANDPVIAIGHYAILIQLCKLFEQARNRDHVQVLALSLLTVMASCLFAVGDQVWFAVVVAGYLALACHTAMLMTLKRGLDVAVETHLPTEAGPLSVHKVAWNVRRDWPARPLRRVLVPVLISMLTMGALFFVVAPRGGLSPSPLGRDEKSSAATTGYSDTVQLGDAKEVYLSDHVAMRVRLSVAPANDLFKLEGPLYLRGHVQEVYSRNLWTPYRPADGHWEPIPTRPMDPRVSPPPPGRLRQEIRMVRSILPTLFGTPPVEAVWVGSRSVRAEKTATGEMRLESIGLLGESAESEVSYIVESWLPHQAGAPSPRDEFYTVEPSGGFTPWVQLKAQEWCRDLLAQRGAEPARREQINLAIAERLAQKLRDNYKYSLDLSGCNPKNDGVEDFLRYMKQGHCEYFASAMTLLCRSLDLRARLATGFRVDEFGLPGQQLLVRDRDAHAWTEVYSPSRGWVVFDATPAGSPLPVPKPWYSFLTDSWQGANQFWYQKVIRYSRQDQSELKEAVGGWFEGIGTAVGDFFKDLWAGLAQLLAGGAVDRAVVEMVIFLGAVAAVGEGIVLVHLIRTKTRLTRVLRRSLGERWRQGRFLTKLLRLLERKGIPHRPEMTLRETVLGAAERFRLPADQAGLLVGLFYRLRWGGEDLKPQEIVAADETVSAWAGAMAHKKRRE